MLSPYISVIVTAHNRRQYLPEALHSLESQILDRSKFEVIVVKNFEDPKSDEMIRRNGWKHIVIPGRTDVIQKITMGLEEAKGEIVTFLEDDDVYAPERLAYIYVAFRRIKDLLWLHNMQTYIDERGNVIPDDDIRVRRLAYNQPRFSLLLRSNDRVWLRVIARYVNIHHNVSSTAVPRYVAEGLRGLRGMAPDLDLQIIAGLHEGFMLHTSRRLTYFRVHASSTTGNPSMLVGLSSNEITLFFKNYDLACNKDPFSTGSCLLLYLKWGFRYLRPTQRFAMASYVLFNALASKLFWGETPNLGSLQLAYWPIMEYVPITVHKLMRRISLRLRG